MDMTMESLMVPRVDFLMELLTEQASDVMMVRLMGMKSAKWKVSLME
jgi:hypothetical protein